MSHLLKSDLSNRLQLPQEVDFRPKEHVRIASACEVALLGMTVRTQVRMHGERIVMDRHAYLETYHTGRGMQIADQAKERDRDLTHNRMDPSDYTARFAALALAV